MLQADGGTRTASITGGWVALRIAIDGLVEKKLISESPLTDTVAAISCGIYQGTCVLDLDYPEDSTAQADSNFVISGNGGLVEIQGTAEEDPFSRDQFNQLLDLALQGASDLKQLQLKAVGDR